MANTTGFDVVCGILADVWLEYRDEDGFKDLIEYADLGFPLAYAFVQGIIPKTDAVEDLVDNTWVLLLEMLKVSDSGFENITDLFETAERNSKEE